MKQHRTKKHSSNYCRNCKAKVRKYRLSCPFCGKFIFRQLPLLLISCAVFAGIVYVIMEFVNSFPPVDSLVPR